MKASPSQPSFVQAEEPDLNEEMQIQEELEQEQASLQQQERATVDEAGPAALPIAEAHAAETTIPAPTAGEHAAGEPQPQQKAARACNRRVYSVGFSDTKIGGRRRPGEFSRESFAVLLEDCHSKHFQRNTADGLNVNKVEKVMVFQEKHANGEVHFYGIVGCARPYSGISVQNELQEKNVYTSFGASHTCFWTAVVYGGVPSEHKGPEEIDPQPYHSLGRSLREELADMPRMARKAEKARVAAHLGLPVGKGGGTEKILNKEELGALIVEHNWTKPEDIRNAAKQSHADHPLLYNTLLHMGERSFQDFHAWLWQLEGHTEEPNVDRIAKLAEAALTADCICEGRWKGAADYLLQLQGLEATTFKYHVLRALYLGRRKGINVLIVGEPDAGKSFLLKPLGKIFVTFIARGQKETFPLQGIHGSEICLLQDVRYESFGLPWDDWLRWGENEDMMVKLPRSSFASSKLYTGTAPLFATMSDLFHFPPVEARQTGRDVERENVQFRSRWCIQRFQRSVPAAARDSTLQPCAKCAAEWYTADDIDPAQNHPPPTAQTQASDVPALMLPRVRMRDENATEQPASRARVAGAADPQAWQQLVQLMQWQTEGRLTQPEFEAAKRRILGL
jgi:hypothetical protein